MDKLKLEIKRLNNEDVITTSCKTPSNVLGTNFDAGKFVFIKSEYEGGQKSYRFECVGNKTFESPAFIFKSIDGNQIIEGVHEPVSGVAYHFISTSDYVYINLYTCSDSEHKISNEPED